MHLRRRDNGDLTKEEVEAPRSPRAVEGEDLHRVEQGEEERSDSSPTTLVDCEPEPSALAQRLCAMDVCEIFSPERVGR